MCGIALLYSLSACHGKQSRMMKNALERMQHRGPDDMGTWQGENVSIGHRRLSIIDLRASRQPMRDPSGRFILTYNGEIYNYKELRSVLEASWDFCTDGDTEVLLAGLITFGEKILEKLEGMWAFALWDNLEKKLLLCRDRIGKKPLYYQQRYDGFICASELPALSCLNNQPWEEDLDSTADYLRHGYYLPGTTAYKDVREVLPGHLLTWSAKGSKEQKPYWSLPVGGYLSSREQASDELSELLIQAVQKRLVADVEVGAFLSGGVDSSLIVSILSKRLQTKAKTFTIGFQERSYDERKYAAQIAKDCGTDHYVEELVGWDQSRLTDLILNNVGQPFADSSILPTALVSEVASRHVKVVLSGDGGDELFSGYQRYQARSILRWYTRLPKSLQAVACSMIRSLPEPMAHHSHSILKKAHLFQDIVDRLAWETPYVAPVLYTKKDYQRLFPDLVDRGHKPPNLPDECCLDDIQRMMTADTLIYLPQDIMLKVDRASMACSLETRAPFLDRKVVEMAFSFRRSWHRSGIAGKKMLRRSFQNHLPDNIWKRRKQGFGVPIHDWFRGELGTMLERLLESSGMPVNQNKILELLAQHRQGARDQGYRLWSIYIYLLWKKQQITKN